MNFDTIYQKYKKILISYLYNITNSKEVSEDILQESLIKFWKNYHKYSFKNDNYLPVLYQICKNTAYDYIKKNKPIIIQNNILLENTVDKGLYSKEHILDRINLIVSQLEDVELKELYYLLLDNKLKKKDLAKSMNISDRQLRRKVKKLIETLKTELEKKDEGT